MYVEKGCSSDFGNFLRDAFRKFCILNSALFLVKNLGICKLLEEC